jgi:hypothetical protein
MRMATVIPFFNEHEDVQAVDHGLASVGEKKSLALSRKGAK